MAKQAAKPKLVAVRPAYRHHLAFSDRDLGFSALWVVQ